MPPTKIRTISKPVYENKTARAAPNDNEPTSPINIEAGLELYHKNPIQTPAIESDNNDTSLKNEKINIIYKVNETTAVIEAASPSNPSVRFTAFTAER